MRKITLLFLSLICFIVLCSCTENNNPVSTPPSTEVSSTADVSATPSLSPAPPLSPTQSAADESSTPSPDVSLEPQIPERPEDAVLNVIIDGELTLISAELEFQNLNASPYLAFSIYFDAESFSLGRSASGYRFTSVNDPETFLEILFISGSDSNTLRPSFADSYGDFYDIEYSSYVTVGESALSCLSVRADNDEYVFHAFLTDVDGGAAAFVVKASSWNEFYDIEKLDAMLATLILYEDMFE